MNKQKLKELAKQSAEMAAAAGELAKKSKALGKTAEPREANVEAATDSRREIRVPVVMSGEQEFQARLYVALVGSADYLRTQASVADICRFAFERSEVAVKVWLRERAKREARQS